MSSKPFISIDKPDFNVIINDFPIQCIKAKLIKNSELIANYLQESPESNSFSINLPYIAVDSEYSLISEVLTNFNDEKDNSIQIYEKNSRLLLQISQTFQMKSLEEKVNEYINDKLLISRSFYNDEKCYLLKRIETTLVDLTDELFNSSVRSINTILLLRSDEATNENEFQIPRKDFSIILLNVMTSIYSKLDLYIEFLKKLNNSDGVIKALKEIILSKLKNKEENPKFFADDFNNSFCYVLRRIIQENWILSDEIKFSHFLPPMMSDYIFENLDRMKLSEEYHNYAENIERMKSNNWKLHKMYARFGHNEDPLMAIIRNDQIDAFRIATENKNFQFCRTVYNSPFERCDMVNHDCEIVEYAAFFGAQKVFQYIFENLEIIPKSLTRFAIAGGNDYIIKYCEEKGLSFYNCLEIAIQFHRWRIFEWLCEKKVQNISLGSLVECCISNSNYQTLDFLLGKGTNFSKFFVWALKYNNPILANFYLSLNLPKYLNEYDDETGLTPLHLACLHGYESIMLNLIQQEKVNLNLLSQSEKKSILHFCCMNGSKHMCIEILNRNGVDVNLRDTDGFTPLHIACQNGFYDIVKLLVHRNGINVNIKSISGKTPLIIACENGYLDIFKEIMSLDPQLTPSNEVSDDDFHKKRNSIDKTIMDLILRSYIVDFDKDGDMSIIQAAAKSGNLNVVKTAIAFSTREIDYFTPTTMTAFSYACEKGSLDVVTYFVEKLKVDYNQVKLISQIPLNIACLNGCTNVAFYLFSLPSIIRTGESLYLASSNNHLEIVKKILTFDEAIFPFNEFGLQSLCISCKKGYYDVVKALLDSKKVPVNSKSDNMGPIHYACKYNYPDIVKLLISNPKVDINMTCTEDEEKNFSPEYIPNLHHMSPLHYAIKENNTEIAKLLLNDPRINVNVKAQSISFLICFII